MRGCRRMSRGLSADGGEQPPNLVFRLCGSSESLIFMVNECDLFVTQSNIIEFQVLHLYIEVKTV
jgi:hypothetical protein